MSVRLLAVDIDGTLAHQGDEILPATREALARAHREGVEVVIATGRRYRTTRRVIDNLELEVAAVILDGAVVKDVDGTTSAQRPLTADDVADLVALTQEAEVAAVGQRDGHTDDGPDFVIDGRPRWNGWTSRYAEANQAHYRWHADLAQQRWDDLLVLSAFGREDELQALVDAVHGRHPDRFATQLVALAPSSPSRGGFYAGIRPAGICKWTGLELLMEARGLSADEVCAVGDERNDLTMIEAAGVGVAMGNAHEDLRRAADWTTGTCDEAGLVRVVDHLLAGGR